MLLDKEFEKAIENHKKEVEQILNNINQQLKKLENICENNGLPFRLNLNINSDVKIYYNPSSYNEKWKNKENQLDDNYESYDEYDKVKEELHLLGGNSRGYEGWQYSYIC